MPTQNKCISFAPEHERDKKITNLEEFLADTVKILYRLRFRGHSDISYKLQPSIGRNSWNFGNNQDKQFSYEQEELFLHRFRRHAFTHSGAIISEWEALLLGRHHELPTRLLDWSSSPLVSIYFACWKHHDKDGRISAIAQEPDNHNTLAKNFDIFKAIEKNEPKALVKWKKVEKIQKVTNDSVRVIFPITSSPRIVAQSGIFTWHSNPSISLEDYAKNNTHFKGKLDVHYLYQWLIPKESKSGILKSLERLGVSRRTLFPDLDGIAASIWQNELLQMID